MDFERTRLDKVIRRRYGKDISQSTIEKAIRNKDILVNGQKVPSSFKVLEESDEIYVHDSFGIKNIQKINNNKWGGDKFKELIIYEDENIIAINKPSGLAVQLGTSIKTAVDVMAKEYNSEARLVHRIDRNTSGITILSKNLKTSRYMLYLFNQKEVRKTYIMIVSSADNLKNGVVDAQINNKRAITEYKVIKELGDGFAFLEAFPKTGRMHQIRIHMQHIGCPILGDTKYGGKKHKNFCLHSHKVTFKDLDGKLVHLIAPIPEYILKYCKLLNN
ncbi:MAG: RluA family pseudouridine synthase [Holosporales bacterium]|nr:RluA family pseudouridine synthase [Holosporales bacterium]